VSGPDPIGDYIRFFETLSPASLDRLPALVTDDIVFRDPFNDVRGIASMRRVFERMFADVAQPRFSVSAAAREGDLAFLRWRFTGRTRGSAGGSLTLEGVSEVHVAEDGRVWAHIDHWDAAGQVYERLPLLGWMLRRVRRRLAA
jgi:ketosteroid isomerase-like protein